MSNRCCILLLIALALCTGGCSLPGKPSAAARQTYLLHDNGAPVAAADTQARQCLSLRVGAPASAPGYGTIRMVYVEQPPRLDYFAYHEWADTPARMIQAVMESRLTTSGLFGVVVSGSTDVRTALRLDAELQKMHQDFTGAASSVVFAIKVGLVEMSSRSLLASRTFTYTESAAGADPASGAQAADRAVQQFLADLTAFVAEAISAHDCAPG